MNEETLPNLIGELHSDSFGPYFSARVMLALSEREAAEFSWQEFANGLLSAFYRLGLAAATASLLGFLWTQIHQGESRSTTTLDQELDLASYRALEELI